MITFLHVLGLLSYLASLLCFIALFLNLFFAGSGGAPQAEACERNAIKSGVLMVLFFLIGLALRLTVAG